MAVRCHETGEFPSTPHGAAVASAWVGVERPPAGYSSHASRRLGRAEDGLIDADRCWSMLIDITHKDRDIIPGASFHVKWTKRKKQMQQLLVRVERDTCRSNRPKIFLWGLDLFLFFCLNVDFIAICRILELETAISTVLFAIFWSSNLSFSMV